MKITKRQLRKIISEALALDLEVGDVILTGRFKNKRTVVKSIDTDELGQPIINGMKALSFRIEKLMPKSKWSKNQDFKHCANCTKRFIPLFVRRHHCRICGEIFCGK